MLHFGLFTSSLFKKKLFCLYSDEVIEKVINSGFKDFENAMQYFSALAANCNLIITKNEKDFKNALIPVMNAESYLNTLKKVTNILTSYRLYRI